MAEPSGAPSAHSVWHGHTLRPLPAGERWFSGGGSQPRTAPPARPAPNDDLWLFEEVGSSRSATFAAAQAPSGSARRTGVVLALVSLAAIVTILVARHSGPPAEPAPLPTPPSHVITAVSRANAAAATIRVGEYLQFQLPSGRTYSTVLEQPSAQVPVVEALTLPGQQPQLRADSAGHAVIEVMSAPVCTDPDGCPDQRTLLGAVDLTVTP